MSTDASPSEPPQVELLQRRVALFALIFGGVNLAGLVLRSVAFLIWTDELAVVPSSVIPLQAVSTAALLTIWGLTRGAPRTERFVRWVEAIGVFVASTAYQVIGWQMTNLVTHVEALRALAEHPELGLFGTMAMSVPMIGVAFILTYAMVLRAAFVPTSARHTFALTVAAGAALPGIAWIAGTEGGAPMTGPLSMALGAAGQWAFTVFVCVTISQVIYGLREEVREARRLGQYTLLELIGEGGMGMVYRASHEMLRRPTAIKLLPPSRAGADGLERFEREVQLTAQLTHPNAVTVFDYGRTAEGVLYYAMELLDGATLEEIVEIDGPQPAHRVIHVLEQVAGALGEAHAIGLIHRDIKPANIVLCRQGGELDVAKVVDFGLVKEMSDTGSVAVSQEGTISGTPLYMAPEILRKSHAAGPLSDLYALGAVGYYLLTGTHLFEGHSVIEVLGHHLHTPPEPPSQRLGDEVPDDLAAVLLDCLAKDPAERPASASDLRDRLEACDGAGSWKQRAAEMWWKAHGPALVTRRTRPPAPTGETAMTVDLGDRLGPDSV